MAKVYHKKEEMWTNYKIGDIGNLVESADMSVISTNKVKSSVVGKKFKK
jgi:hypothetical protein